MVKRYARDVRQRAQFHSIDSALELFSNNSGWGGYPPSDAMDSAATPLHYCGAMKLCEAMMGQDLAGFHPESRFLADGTNGTTGYYLYDSGSGLSPDAETNLKARKGPYLQSENANAYRLSQLYGAAITPFTKDLFVLCDVYNRVKNVATGKGVGMPILYYRANTLNTIHDTNAANLPILTDDKGQIYNYLDNDELVHLGPSGVTHPLDDGTTFYKVTKDNRISITTGRPYRPDSYILISAGYDGIYGTDDDIFNFEK
jgi:hypothetical protein